MSIVLSIATTVFAAIALAIKIIEIRSAHRKILMKLLRRAAGVSFLLFALGMSVVVAYLGGSKIIEFAFKPDAPSRFEIIFLILNFINLSFYSMTSVGLATLLITSLRKPKPIAETDVTTPA